MKRKTKSFNEMLWENEDSLTLEEIKKEIKEYKDDQSFCIDGLNNIKSKYKKELHPIDSYCLGEIEIQLLWQNSIIKNLLKIIKTIK